VNVVDLRGIQSQEEKFFFVEMLLQQFYNWIMKQQGVQNLRFLLYFDEVVGYCPPVREPPSKKSLLLLIKQARAFGLGIVLATQNPIDIDYKVISNANVRLIGRLATERDVQRVKAGLELPEDSALTIQSLENGQFLFQIFDPRTSGIVSPRWLMTYHRGPLRDEEISSLMAGLKEGVRNEAEAPTSIPSPTQIEGGIQVPPMPAVQQSLKSSAPAEISQPPAPEEPAKQAAVLGIPFGLKPDEVPDRVPRQKKLFGQSEVIGEVKPVYRLLLELGIGLKTGVLTRKYQTKYLFIDAVTGMNVELGKKLVLHPGLERFIGLDSRDIEVLRNLNDDKYSSAVDLENRMKMSVDLVRNSLQQLERKRLAKSTQIGRAKAYKRIIGIPNLELEEIPINPSEVEFGGGVPPMRGPTETELREVVRGLRQDYDLVSFRPFYYPLYSVYLALGNRSRIVWIDGTTGEVVPL